MHLEIKRASYIDEPALLSLSGRSYLGHTLLMTGCSLLRCVSKVRGPQENLGYERSLQTSRPATGLQKCDFDSKARLLK